MTRQGKCDPLTQLTHVQVWMYEEFEDTKDVIIIRKSKKNRQHNGQKDKQRSTKHFVV